MKEKRFKLDLSAYTIEVDVRKPGEKELVKETIDYPIRDNLSGWLRTVGMFKCATDVAEAVCLAKQIRDTKNDYLILDGKEARVLKMVVDKHLELAADTQLQFPLGGVVHEEAICRVANMEEVEKEAE